LVLATSFTNKNYGFALELTRFDIIYVGRDNDEVKVGPYGYAMIWNEHKIGVLRQFDFKLNKETNQMESTIISEYLSKGMTSQNYTFLENGKVEKIVNDN